jgi:uncharacterized protein (DUF362 family)
MPHPDPRARVILRHVDTYDPERIRTVIREGLDTLGLKPRGRTLVKPNLVAAGPLFEHAHTRVEFMEGVLRALQDRSDGNVEELAVGERCGITIPTRFIYEGAGYDPMLERVGVKRYCFDEVSQVQIPLTHEGRLRDYLFTPEPIAKADFFVNCPKFKAHPWTTVTFSMKNYIGIQDDRHRLIDHDHALNRKVADLQYIIQPQFIAIDAIIAGEGRMLTPIPKALNLVIMGNNQVAFDSVCSRIIGLDPHDIEHIQLAHERGFGPMEQSEIEISGDVSFDEAKERAKGFRCGLIRVEKYFEGTNISAYAGPPPGHDETGYCWGGCPGVLEEVIEILRLYDEQCDAKMPKIHMVFGDYKGPLDIKHGEKVIFIGDCVKWDGEIDGQLVQIASKYKDRTTMDPHDAIPSDIYVKMAKMAAKLVEARRRPYIRLDGCPISIAEIVLVLSELGGVQNPYFDKRQIVGFNRAYLTWRAVQSWRMARGVPYQIRGDAERGEAAPHVSAKEVPPPAE